MPIILVTIYEIMFSSIHFIIINIIIYRTPQDDVYEIERPLSLISISPLSYDQGMFTVYSTFRVSQILITSTAL